MDENRRLELGPSREFEMYRDVLRHASRVFQCLKRSKPGAYLT
jgi:hypothetical protein